MATSESHPKTPPKDLSSARNYLSPPTTRKLFKSTPTKANLSDLSHKKSTTDFHLKNSLRRRILETTLDKYVKEVLYVSEEEFGKRRSKDWAAVKRELKDDIEAYLSAKQEKDYYNPFQRIIARIIERADSVFGEKLNFPFNLECVNHSDMAVGSSYNLNTRRLPDFVFSLPNSNPYAKKKNKRKRKDGRMASSWEDIFLIMELKKRLLLLDEITNIVSTEVLTNAVQSSASSGSLPVPSVHSSRSSSKVNSSRHSNSSRSKAPTKQPRVTSQSHDSFEQGSEPKGYFFRQREVGVVPSFGSSTSSKRKAPPGGSSQNKRLKSSYIASEDPDAMDVRLNAEEQLANYATDLFSDTGLRSHTLGMLVTDTWINFWYFDREGCIKTESFDFIEDFDYFAAIIISFMLLDAHQWGFHSFLNIPPGITPHVGNDVTAATMTIDGVDVRLTGLIHQQYGLIGRGTVVFSAEVTGGNRKDMIGESTVVKSSWQAATRPQEAETIKTARERLNEKEEFKQYLQNLPEVYASSEGIRLSSFRSRILGEDNNSYEDRILRTVLLPQYESIWYLPLKQFVKVIREIFCCHYALWICLILHRDISINNVMCRKVGDEYIGILLDFDLAVILDEQRRHPEQKSKFRTGTLMFMATDLLNGVQGPHLYRYDLESFLYVMIWRSCGYADDNGRIMSGLSDWMTGSAAHLSLLKSSIFHVTGPVGLPLMDDYKPILAWFLPLIRMFRRGFSKRTERQEETYGETNVSDPEDETLYGHVTHDEFWKILQTDLDYSQLDNEESEKDQEQEEHE